ncbi:uncharacterized protein UTRI_05138_B [Ustilago trichophora]|uniref:Uncharacterized protein n=1 Tax=Ustilago trichophora TaxID=86804 RepID=A0A5C3EDT1_9BASI|nr:uncharacterized protein UTRI_05138_B [Ustilago trichophora]
MATLEMQRPQRSAATTSRRSPSLPSVPLSPSSPTIIRTPDFILLPSVPTHEPEDNLPSPHALQHQFAMAALSDAEARRSRHSSTEEARTATSSRSDLSHNSPHMADNDELEEIVEPESAFDGDATSNHDALRDIRNQQLESLQSIVHSIAESHFQKASPSLAPHSEITQILDDMFASLRRIGGHNAPLSPTFSRSSPASLGLHQMSDVDRLVLLVDRFTLAVGNVDDATEAGLLANLNTLTHALVDSDRRMTRAAMESPPRTPRTLNWSDPSHRRRSSIQQHQQSQHSPQSSTHMSGSRGSWSSFHSYATLSTSSDEAAAAVAAGDSGVEMQHKDASRPREPLSAKTRRFDLLAEAGLLSAVPEQQHVDGSVFDMATVRQAPAPLVPSTSTTFSIETLYARPPVTSGVVAPQSPRSDQASRAASVGERSDSTALPNRKRFSVQTDSAASTTLPGYTYDVPGYDALSTASQEKKAAPLQAVDTPESDGLPQYDGPSTAAGYSGDVKTKPLETPTLLERRRAKLAAQHSAYAARTPEDLAMVQSSIDRLSTVMPQLDNQRVLSPDEQREAQLQHIIGRLNHSNSKRFNDQRSNPPTLKATRPAPLPQIETKQAPIQQARELLPKPAPVTEAARSKVLTAEPEAEMPATPTTPVSLHSNSTSSRRGSLLPGAFGRKLSIASIGNALRRASIYDTTKVKPKDSADKLSDTLAGNTATVRRRAATQDSRTKYDIAGELSSLFNDGKPRKNSAHDDVSSASKLASQTGFRAIDFADDTPRGRDASLMPRASVEEEDDSMLDDYSFATFDTQSSNHRLSVVSTVPDSPRSPVSWASSSGSHISSRRSSQLLSSNPATPTWPKSPLTPISPVAPKKTNKTMVTFAADTLQPPAPGRSRAASLQSQMRENGLTPLRPRKYPDIDSAVRDPPVCASASASTSTTATSPATALATASVGNNDLVVYSVFLPNPADNAAFSGKSNAADTSVRSASVTPTTHQNEHVQVDLEFFVEAQHALGSISVMLWSSSSTSNKAIELEYHLVDNVGSPEQQHDSRMLRIAPVDSSSLSSDVSLCIAGSCESESSGSDSGNGRGIGEKRKLNSDHVSPSVNKGVYIKLPAAAISPQTGNVTLDLASGCVSRFKLDLTEAERKTGAEESRAEGMVDFPLSAAELSASEMSGFGCAVCAKTSKQKTDKVTEWGAKTVQWRALPSEGWEELVDAWMCHGDQELNRSLTETAVRFSSKVHSAAAVTGDGKEQERDETVWVGDTYILLPQSLVITSNVELDESANASGQTVVRCATCHTGLGELSGSNGGGGGGGGGGATVKLTKYFLQPILTSFPTSEGVWVETLLSELQYSAAAHGSRRFLLHSKERGVETWLFSRARFTTSLHRFWSTLHANSVTNNDVWKGYRIFYRTPQESGEETAVEKVDLPDPIFNWTSQAFEECNDSLPQELKQVLPGWKGAYLARPV